MSTITQLQRSMRDEGCCDSGRVDDSFIAYMPAQPIDIKHIQIVDPATDTARPQKEVNMLTERKREKALEVANSVWEYSG